MERSEKPVLVITNPKITTIPVGNDSLAVEERYDYSVSHIIYEGIDLGSLEEIKKLRADNKSLRGSLKALGEKDNNQRKELIRLNKVIDKLKYQRDELKAEVQEANDNAAWWQSRFNALSKRGE